MLIALATVLTGIGPGPLSYGNFIAINAIQIAISDITNYKVKGFVDGLGVCFIFFCICIGFSRLGFDFLQGLCCQCIDWQQSH
ncbi:MAG: hypothetical protein Q3W86_07950 [Evtepia sp.]|nr:hypothetical protein [Evtepia sp.]